MRSVAVVGVAKLTPTGSAGSSLSWPAWASSGCWPGRVPASSAENPRRRMRRPGRRPARCQRPRTGAPPRGRPRRAQPARAGRPRVRRRQACPCPRRPPGPRPARRPGRRSPLPAGPLPRAARGKPPGAARGRQCRLSCGRHRAHAAGQQGQLRAARAAGVPDRRGLHRSVQRASSTPAPSRCGWWSRMGASWRGIPGPACTTRRPASRACGAACPIVVPVVWNRRLTASGCPTTIMAASPRTYAAMAQSGAVQSPSQSFRLK